VTRRDWWRLIVCVSILIATNAATVVMVERQQDELDRTQHAVIEAQVFQLERLKIGQLYDCRDRQKIRSEAGLPPAMTGSTGDCAAIARAYDRLIAQVKQTLDSEDA